MVYLSSQLLGKMVPCFEDVRARQETSPVREPPRSGSSVGRGGLGADGGGVRRLALRGGGQLDAAVPRRDADRQVTVAGRTGRWWRRRRQFVVLDDGFRCRRLRRCCRRHLSGRRRRRVSDMFRRRLVAFRDPVSGGQPVLRR